MSLEQDWKSVLEVIKEKRGMTQSDIGKEVGKSQKSVSSWLASDNPREPSLSAKRWIRRAALELHHNRVLTLKSAMLDWLKKQDLGDEESVTSKEFSIHEHIFRALWENAVRKDKNRMRSAELDAEIRPSKSPEHADVTLRYRLHGLSTPKAGSYLFDVFGLRPKLHRSRKFPGRYWFAADEGTVFTEHEINAPGAHCKIQSVNKTFGPYVFGIRVKVWDPDETIEITLTAERGCRLDRLDAAGIPVYADTITRAVSVCVTFFDLKPVNPKPEVWLLRRSFTEPRPTYLINQIGTQLNEKDFTAAAADQASGKAISDATDDKLISGDDTLQGQRPSFRCSFKNLLYPEGDRAYCIAWRQLKRV